jgi:iron complex outermembrane receptor protein
MRDTRQNSARELQRHRLEERPSDRAGDRQAMPRTARSFPPALLAAAVAAASLPAPALAADVLETVVVTAQKRQQDSQDVGIAITALSGDQLNALGYTNAQEIAQFAPGVVAVQPNGEGNYSFSIRGVANNDLTTNVESPVAVYVDDVYVSQMSGTGFLLFDVASVEVLRGPQGTLFGRNATGGLVHYTTVKPQQQYEAFGRITYGSYDQVKVQGAINVPLGERAAARLSLATHQNSGYIENRVTPGQNLNNANEYGGRLQLSFDPTERLSLLFNIRGYEQDIRTGLFEYISAVDGGGIPTPGQPNPIFNGYIDEDGDAWAGDYDFTGHNIAEVFGGTVTGTLDLGRWEVTSITDYQTVYRDYIEDTDATPYDFYNYFQTNDARQMSQELRVAGEIDRWNLVGGLYYLDIESDDSTGGIAVGMYDYYGITSPDYPANGDRTPSSSATESFSVFGQAEYALTDKLTLIGGLRWIDETRDFRSQRQEIQWPDGARSGLNPDANVVEVVTAFDPAPRDFSLWAGRLQANYLATDSMLLYASFNRGVRSGGFSQPPSDPTSTLLVDEALLSYDPETLDSFEVGIKWDPTARLRVNAAAYRYDYQDYQAYTNFPGALGSATVNGQATNQGFELEVTAAPTDRLEFRLGAGHADVEVTDVIGFEGQTLTSVNTPEWNVNGLVRYEHPIADSRLVVQADFSYMSEHYFGLDVTPAVTEDGYTVVNGLIGWFPNDDRWNLTLQVKNLFEEEYLVQTFDLTDWIGMIEHYYNRPRWASLTLQWNL